MALFTKLSRMAVVQELEFLVSEMMMVELFEIQMGLMIEDGHCDRFIGLESDSCRSLRALLVTQK